MGINGAFPPPPEGGDSGQSPGDLDQLAAFCRALRASPELAAATVAATSPGQIVQIASQAGFAFSLQILRCYSNELKAKHWPWARKDDAWRRRFFDGSRP